MAGLFDLHTLMALESGWTTLKVDSGAWEILFSGVPSSLAEEWRTELISKNVEFTAAYSPGETKFPAVFTRLEDEKLAVQPLSFHINDSQVIDGIKREIVGFEVEETAGIYILAPSAELARALFVAIRAIMVSAKTWLINDAGYSTIEYLGGGDLDPETALFPEGLGIFTRVMRWKAQSTVRIPEIDFVSKPVFVHASDVTIGEHAGGVTAQE